MIKVSVEELIERAFKRALPKFDRVIEENINKNKAKDKYLKRVRNRNVLRGKRH